MTYATVLTVAPFRWLTPLERPALLATVVPVASVLTVPLWPYWWQ